MTVPDSFRVLVHSFNEYTLPQPFDEVVWIERSLARLDVETRAAAKRFISDVLDRNPSNVELREIWHAGGSQYWIDGEGLRPFFELILGAL